VIGDAARWRFMINLQASTIAFISHERKQVVNQYIFPHNLCKMQVFKLVFDSHILP